MEFCLGSLETAPLRKAASQLSPAVPNHRLSTIPDQVRDARADEAQEAHMTWDPLGLQCFPLSSSTLNIWASLSALPLG